jgi:hypothetical protein
MVPPTASPTATFHPSHSEEQGHNPEDPSPHPNAGGPRDPNGDPDPSDDRPNGGHDRDDEDQQNGREPDNDNPFEAHGGADNLSVWDLLCILAPILTECQGAPHIPPVAPPHPR